MVYPFSGKSVTMHAKAGGEALHALACIVGVCQQAVRALGRHFTVGNW